MLAFLYWEKLGGKILEVENAIEFPNHIIPASFCSDFVKSGILRVNSGLNSVHVYFPYYFQRKLLLSKSTSISSDDSLDIFSTLCAAKNNDPSRKKGYFFQYACMLFILFFYPF